MSTAPATTPPVPTAADLEAQQESQLEDKRRRADVALAQANVLNHAQAIGEGARMVIEEAKRVDKDGRRLVPASRTVADTLTLGMALLANRRAAAMAFPKGGRSLSAPPKRVEMVRMPLPAQIAAAQAPAVAPVESEWSAPEGSRQPVQSERAPGACDGPRPDAPGRVVAPDATGADAPALVGELITGDLPLLVEPVEHGPDVLAMALEVEGQGKGMTSALMRALARSRGLG